MSVVISDEVLHAAHLSAEELTQEIAVLLFRQDRLTLSQASRLAGISQFRFQHLLAGRGIAPHYGIAEFEQDLTTLEQLSHT